VAGIVAEDEQAPDDEAIDHAQRDLGQQPGDPDHGRQAGAEQAKSSTDSASAMAVLRWLIGITHDRMILRWGIGAPGATGVLGCEVVDIGFTSSYFQTVDGEHAA
jgi:hypothetical protein